MPSTCCILNCSNRDLPGSGIRFYRFPFGQMKTDKLQAWISAVNRKDWLPNYGTRICSDHFISGKPSDDASNHDYSPCINLELPARKQRPRLKVREKYAAKSKAMSEASVLMGISAHTFTNLSEMKTEHIVDYATNTDGEKMEITVKMEESNTCTSDDDFNKHSSLDDNSYISRMGWKACTSGDDVKDHSFLNGNNYLSKNDANVSKITEDNLSNHSLLHDPYYLSEDCASELQITSEVQGIADSFSSSHEDSTALVCFVYSIDQLIDYKSILNDDEKECTLEPSLVFIVDTNSETCDGESCSTSSLSTNNAMIHDKDIMYKERATEIDRLDRNVQVEDETDTDTAEETESAASDDDCSDMELNNTAKQTLRGQALDGKAPSRHNRCPSRHNRCPARHNRCPLCEKNLSDFQDLKRHIQHRHLCDSPQLCMLCEKSFSTKADLAVHLNYVHGHKKYYCDKCDFTSKFSHTVKLHMSSAHLDEKPHKCPLCNISFSDRKDLKQHGKAAHVCEMPYVCSYCNKIFDRNSALKTHIKNVHICLKPFLCAECGKSFSRTFLLQKHVNTVHLKQRPHTCFVCSKNFAATTHLKIHINGVHNGYRPHQCQLCGRTFTQKSSLKTHMKLVHKDTKPC